MKLKIIFLLFVLFLIVGAGCKDGNDNNAEKVKEEKPAKEINTEDTESEFYDGLDDSLKELDEIEKEASQI